MNSRPNHGPGEQWEGGEGRRLRPTFVPQRLEGPSWGARFVRWFKAVPPFRWGNDGDLKSLSKICADVVAGGGEEIKLRHVALSGGTQVQRFNLGQGFHGLQCFQRKSLVLKNTFLT